MTKQYSENLVPGVDESKDGTLTYVNHCHAQNIPFHRYGWRDKTQLNSDVARQKALVAGCANFWKTLAADTNQSSKVRALAAGAAAKDEAQLAELGKIRSSGCVLL